MTTTTDNNRPFFNSTFFVALSMSLLGASLNLGEEGFTATSVIFAILAVVMFCRASDAIDDAYDRADRADRAEAALARVEAVISGAEVGERKGDTIEWYPRLEAMVKANVVKALDAKVLPRDQRLAHDIADLRARVSKVEEASNYAGGKPSLDDEPRHDREEDA